MAPIILVFLSALFQSRSESWTRASMSWKKYKGQEPVTSTEARRQMEQEKVIHNAWLQHYTSTSKRKKQVLLYQCARLLKLKISPALVPFAAVAVAVTISLHLLTFFRHLFRDHVREIFLPGTLTRHSSAPALLRVVTLT